jgi:predicted ribosomally synthesized peptide with nif11-like leader
MSKENLDQFIQKVTDSEELRARIGEEMDADSLIALGAEHGCEFTADDLTAGAELSDEELDSVAGGMLSVVNNVSSLTYSGARFRMVTAQPKDWANPSFSDSTGYGGKK